MKRRGWLDYDDGFDEAALHDEEDIQFEAIKRRRPRLGTPPRKPKGADRFEDASHRQRHHREKAWGAPY